MFSERVSVHLTGRPSLRASHATSTASGSTIFAPKPPPTSGLTTRTSAGSRPSSPATTILPVCGVCDVAQSVSRPSSPITAAAERGSSGAATSRWLRSTSETTRSQPSNSPSSSSSAPPWFATFDPSSGKRRTSSFTASSIDRTAGSGS